MPVKTKPFSFPGFRDANGHLLIRRESEDNMFRRHDISLHVLNLDTETGSAEIEVCVRGAKHVGIYHTHMVLSTPGCLLADIKKATENLLDQRGPFSRAGGFLGKKDTVGSFALTGESSENLDALVRWLNRMWRDK